MWHTFSSYFSLEQVKREREPVKVFRKLVRTRADVSKDDNNNHEMMMTFVDAFLDAHLFMHLSIQILIVLLLDIASSC